MELSTVLKQLKKLGNPEVIKIKKRFGIAPVYSYGIFLKDLKELAKRIGKNEALGIELFDSEIYEAKLLVPMLYNPQHLTNTLMEKWVKAFDNWEICDTVCMGFFGISPPALKKAFQWVEYMGEF